MKYILKSAFTLVELIVVVTILAILATIGFVSYSGYLTGVRDTNRIASLTSISDGLELYRTKNDLPNPDDGISIQIEGNTIANQGYIGANLLQTIEYSKSGKDPKDDTYYSYYLTEDKKHYQLMAFLEETENLETNNRLITNTNATINYSIRYPKVYGKRLGILTDPNNTPVQEIIINNLNLTGGTTESYIAYFNDSKNISRSGSNLAVLEIIGNLGGNIKKSRNYHMNCKEILDAGKSTGDGIYKIKIDGKNDTEVYCNMTTDGGGWTLLFNRRVDVSNSEQCGSVINEFINGDSCGNVNNIGRLESYSIGGKNKSILFDIQNFFGNNSEVMSLQYLNGSHDSDDTFIISTDMDIFPDSIGILHNISVLKICNLTGTCDIEDVWWKYTGDSFFGSARCDLSYAGNLVYKGMYGYCENGVSTNYSANGGLGGNRSEYQHVKLWGVGGSAASHQERMFIR